MASLVPFNHPFFGGEWWDISPRRIFDQNFGMGLLDEPLGLHHPWGATPYWLRTRDATHGVETGLSEIHNDKNEFAINLDVNHFKPEEIKVKAKENVVEISAKHEEKPDPHGFISRSFTRRYVLPKEVDMTRLVSSLSNEGVLSLHAPKLVTEEEAKERVIPIEMRNRPAAIKMKQQQDGPDVEVKKQT